MIKRAILLAILPTLLLPAAGAAQVPSSRPICFLQLPADPTPSIDTIDCPEAEAVFTLEGMLDLTLDPTMVDPNFGADVSVKRVQIVCAICTGPSCDVDLATGGVAAQTHNVAGQTTVQVPYKVWFGREGSFQGGLLADPADFHSYTCQIWVSTGDDTVQGRLTQPSPFYSVDWGPDRFAKVADTPTPVLELSGTIN